MLNSKLSILSVLFSALALASPAVTGSEHARSGAQQGVPGDTSPDLLSGASAGGSGATNLATPVIPPLFIIAPTEVRTDPELARGCWVRLFPEPEYRGANDLTVAGPIELPSLQRPTGEVFWKPKAESLIVGPSATVTVFEVPNYGNRSATLKPGARLPQLREGLKFTQSIDSLTIKCQQ